MIKIDKVIIFLMVKLQQTLSETNKKTKFSLSIKLIFMSDARKGDNRILRIAGGGGNRAHPILRFSVKDRNGVSPRSADGGGSRAPRTMEKCEGVKNSLSSTTKAEAEMEC